METSEKLKELRATYQKLTDKKPGPTWDEATLQEKIFEFKTSGEGEPPKMPSVSTTVTGNMTVNLDENHPQKNYSFENKLEVAGSRRGRPLYSSDFYHVYMVPAGIMLGKKTPDTNQSPNVQGFAPLEWQASKDFFERAQNVIVTILHDPTRK